MRMPLIELTATERPGRLPEGERTLKDLLERNGLPLGERKKARSLEVHEADLKARMARVLAAEAEFLPGISTAKRKVLRAKLAGEYNALIAAASNYRDDATAAYDDELTALAQSIRAANPKADELFKSTPAVKNAAPSARVANFVTDVDEYRQALRDRYKALYAERPVPALTTADQATLADEQAAVERQLLIWARTAWNAPGCNANGTWGTSKGGAARSYVVSRVNAAVWAELRAWWRGKQETFVWASDSSSYTLNKHRSAGDADDSLSPLFKYHINVG